ncbi:MAG: protoglobin domain-containing protein [Methylococcaceae bacterium]|nr:protoglobin domain-containing protein [Methylococcaceae bacterium]
MAQIDFETLTSYAKSFAGLTPEREKLLIEIGPAVTPCLPRITEAFYAKLTSIPNAAPFLESRLELLKQTHLRWLYSLFTGPFDTAYTQSMYKVGHVHVKVNLPVEFMAGGMALIAEGLIGKVENLYQNDAEKRLEAHGAINAILGFTLIVMQQSFQNASLHEELQKFLKITGMSRTLFDNLAAAFDK